MDCCNFYEHTHKTQFLSHFLYISLAPTVYCFYSQMLDDDYSSLCLLYILPLREKKRMRDTISCLFVLIYIQSTLNKFDKEETWTINKSAQWLPKYEKNMRVRNSEILFIMNSKEGKKDCTSTISCLLSMDEHCVLETKLEKCQIIFHTTGKNQSLKFIMDLKQY